MLIRQITQRAGHLDINLLPWQAYRCVVQEARRLDARIRRSQKFDDTDVDECIRVCRTVENEPPMSTLVAWSMLPPPNALSSAGTP